MNPRQRQQRELQTQLLFPGTPAQEELLREAQALADRMVETKNRMVQAGDRGDMEEWTRLHWEWMDLYPQLQKARAKAGV